MQIHFKTREQARQAKRNGLSGIIDNGADAPKGKRYTFEVQAMATGNNVHNMACPVSGRNVPVFVRGKNKL